MEESSIESIFYSEFHPTLGPKITYQVPRECIMKEKFDSLSVFIIPKPELQGKLITVNAHGYKIIGYPVGLDNSKYDRNRLIFNLCFVCEASKRTVQFEPIVRKLSNYLKTLEIESNFLSNASSKSKLPEILSTIYSDLNRDGQCSIRVDESSNTIYLKVIRVHRDPPEIMDQDVPIFLNSSRNIFPKEWDLTTQQWDITAAEILPFIDGFRHVACIAAEADVEISLVKACVQNLVYYGIVTVIPIFQYSNVYTPTPKIATLTQDSKLQDECVKFVVQQGHPGPPFRSIFQLYCGLCPGTTVKDLCIRYTPHRLGIDERKLIQFGLIKGLIRRLHKYPVLANPSAKPTALNQYYTGLYNYDQICCKTGLSYQELDEKVEQDPHVIVCWK